MRRGYTKSFHTAATATEGFNLEIISSFSEIRERFESMGDCCGLNPGAHGFEASMDYKPTNSELVGPTRIIAAMGVLRKNRRARIPLAVTLVFDRK